MSAVVALLRPLTSPRRTLAMIGRPVLQGARTVARVSGFCAAIVLHALRLATWRRTVRAAFAHELHETGVGVLSAVVAAAMLVGIGLVGQGLYWLQAAGQTGLVAGIVRIVLIREIAPVMVGLVLVGRAGIGTLMELGTLRVGGQLRMLESQGIDPFHLLVVPRVLAMAASGFCLTMVFILASLATGFVAASLVGTLQLSLVEFSDRLVAGLDVRTFAMIAIKSLAIGFAVSTACCYTALAARGDPERAVTAGFMRALIAVLVVNGAISLVL